MTTTLTTYKPTPLEVQLQLWLRSAVTAFDSVAREVPVIFEKQDGPRPLRPFVSLAIQSQRLVGGPSVLQGSTVGPDHKTERMLYQFWSGAVRVTAHGIEGREIMEAICASWRKPNVQRLNVKTRKIAITAQLSDLMDTSFQRDAKNWEKQFTADFGFYIRTSDTERDYVIDRVTMTGEIGDLQTTIDTGATS